MKVNGKYWVAVALLAILAVVFGLAGAVAPVSRPAMLQQESSSDSVTHFTYPPTFDSGWLNITDKCGQYFTLVHSLSSMDVTVDITGRTVNLTQEKWHQFWSMGDVNRDGCIDDTDGDLINAAFGSTPGDPNWNPDADLNQDGHVWAEDKFTWGFNYGRDIWTYFGARVHQRNLGGTAYMPGWSKTYGGKELDWAYSVVRTDDGGYALAGETYSFGATYSSFYLVKTDAHGNMQWNKTYGGTGNDWAESVVQTDDGGYVLAGNTWSSGGYDFWLVKTDVESGLAWTGLTSNSITLYRGKTDPYWNFVRVRIWLIKEPTWIYGDINQDGVVDAKDLYILSQNYGTTLSILSLSGIIAVAGIHTYRKRKQPA